MKIREEVDWNYRGVWPSRYRTFKRPFPITRRACRKQSLVAFRSSSWVSRKTVLPIYMGTITVRSRSWSPKGTAAVQSVVPYWSSTTLKPLQGPLCLEFNQTRDKQKTRYQHCRKANSYVLRVLVLFPTLFLARIDLCNATPLPENSPLHLVFFFALS